MRRFSTSPGAAGGTNQAFDSFSRREVTGSHGVARRAVTGSHGVARGSPEETSRRSCSAHSDGDLGGKLSTVGVSWLGSVHLSGCGARGSSNKDPSPAPRLLNPLRKEMRRVKGHRDQAGSDWDASPDSHSGSPQRGHGSPTSQTPSPSPSPGSSSPWAAPPALAIQPAPSLFRAAKIENQCSAQEPAPSLFITRPPTPRLQGL